MHRSLKIATAGLIAVSAESASAKESLNIGIVTFSTSDIHTNQKVDTMSAEAKSKGWTVEPLNANGDPSQAIAEDQTAGHKEGRRHHCDRLRLDWACRGTAGGRRREDTCPVCRRRHGPWRRARGVNGGGRAPGRLDGQEFWGAGWGQVRCSTSAIIPAFRVANALTLSTPP